MSVIILYSQKPKINQMKKILLSLGVIALVTFTGCSSDDDNNNNGPGSGPLVKKIVFDYVDDDYSDQITFTYNGTKLVQGVYPDGTLEKYYYAGDRIIKTEFIEDGEVTSQILLTYDAQGRVTDAVYQELDWDFEERSSFEYTSETTAIESYYTGSLGSSTLDWTATLTLADGEIVQKVQSGPNGKTYTYTYDTKNSPFKNVTGYGALSYATAGDHETEGRSKNILKITNDTDDFVYTQNTFTYNDQDFPTSLVSVARFNDWDLNITSTLNAQFFYE
jgi:hypothetical protein